MTPKTAFVIMPIKKEETDEHEHFLTIYSKYVKPILGEFQYEIIRVDEDIVPGPIDKKLVNYLATSDLVIADLSTLNPNVFYELGIRHALKAKGTILIVDDSITPHIPFNVHNYTTIHFNQEAKGLGKLMEKLRKTIKELQTSNITSDNPIYDWIDGQKARNRVDSSGEVINYSQLIDILDHAKFEADNNLTPRKILDEAQMAILETADNQPDLSKFLVALRKFIELKIFVRQPDEFVSFYELIEKTDLRGKLARETVEMGMTEYPTNSKIFRALIGHLAHSEKADDREIAKQKIKIKLKIEVNNRTVTGIDSLTNLGENVHLISLMLDAYHRDGLNDDALKIAENLLKQFPNSTAAARNYARALSNSGRSESEVIAAYTNAINCDDVDDVTARWFASYLWRKAKYAQAIEMIIFACRLDYSEADSFAMLAAIISAIMVPRNDIQVIRSGFKKPEWFKKELIIDCIWISKTCDNFGTDQRAMCNDAQKNAGITRDELTARYFYATRENAIEFILPLYEMVKSELTNKIIDVSTGQVNK